MIKLEKKCNHDTIKYLRKNRDLTPTYSKKNNFVWMRIPKVAGISMQRHVLDLHVKDAIVPFPRKNKTTQEEVDKQMRWLYGDDAELSKEIINNAFVFTIVRNPWDRAVSIWKYFTTQVKEYNRLPECSFLEFLEKDYFNYNQRVKTHSIPQVKYIMEKENCFIDAMFKLEEISKNWSILKDKMNINAKLEFPSKHKTIKKNKHYTEYYTSQRQIDIVNRKYKEDIDFLNYKFGE